MPANRNSEKHQQTSRSVGGSLKSIPGNPISSRTRSSGANCLKSQSTPKRTIQRGSKSAGRRSTARGRVTKSGGKTSTSTAACTQSTPELSANLTGGEAAGQSQSEDLQHSSKLLESGSMLPWLKNSSSHHNPLQDNDEPMPMTPPSNTSKEQGENEDLCVVCMCPPDKPKKLEKCGHIFCGSCIDQCFSKMNPICPICGTVYGRMEGNMPRGTMNSYVDSYTQLPGYSGCGSIVIRYDFPNGTQTSEHPHPGRMYYGTRRIAYLPDNAEGRKVCKLLKKAFDMRMTFTVGRSATTGLDDQVIWNDVHHKTSVNGGPTSFGYPDATYLCRVQEELAAKGVVEH